MFSNASLFLTQAHVWSITYFYLYVYIFLIFSIIIYLISNVKDFLNYNKFSKLTNFSYVTGFDLMWLLFTPLILIYLVNFSWTSPIISAWFGHLIFTSFQYKIVYFMTLVFLLLWIAYISTFYYSSQEVYDYTLVTYSFFFWMLLMFFTSNFFTMIFFIEILSTLITLLLVTSVFSSVYFYNNLSLNNASYFSSSTPFSFLQTLIFFFWVSLIGSLNLFVFLTLFYIKFLTFDWFLIESIFYYVVAVSDIKSLFFIALAWFNLIFCIFLKCGLVPFYFWKPIFFKGIPLHALFFYIFFFYFFIFLFFLYFFLVYVNSLFYFNILINMIILLVGSVFLIFILCESYYIKAFLAMSSILNTLFVFLAMTSFSTIDMMFIL